jgi:hypothetical protein
LKTQDLETQDTREEAAEAHMENLYGFICRQPNQEAVIATLEDYALRDLNGYLARMNAECGIPGLIRGLVMVEACERFMKNEGGEE